MAAKDRFFSIVRFILYRVEYPIILFMLSFQLYQPLIEQYYYKTYGLELIGEDELNATANQAFCLTNELITNYTGDNETYKRVQSEANHLVAYGQLIQNIVAVVVTTFVIGPLTDRFGRKVGLAIPAMGSILQGIASICIIFYNLDPYYFLLTNFVAGLSGSFTSLLSSSFTYTTEDSSVKYRTLRIAAIEASIAFGGAMGQLFGGLLLEAVHCNYIPPMILFLVSNAVMLPYVIFVLPEPSTRECRMGGLTSKWEQFIAYLKGFKVYFGGLSIKATWNIYVATLGANIAAITITGAGVVCVFFLKTPPFDLKPLNIGIYQAVRSTSQGFSNVILVGLFTVLFRNPDPWILLAGFLFSGLGNLFFGLSNQTWQIFILALFQGTEGIAWSGTRGLASKLVQQENLSALFSIMASLESLSSMLGATVWPLIFPATLNHHLRSGTTYFIIAALSLLMVPLSCSLFVIKPKHASKEINHTVEEDQDPLIPTEEEEEAIIKEDKSHHSINS